MTISELAVDVCRVIIGLSGYLCNYAFAVLYFLYL